MDERFASSDRTETWMNFSSAYRQYRHCLDKAELVLRKWLPGWNIEVREHRKDSFEILLCPPLSRQGNERLFYLSKSQVESILSPDFKCGLRNFFGFDLIGFWNGIKA